MNGKTMSIKSMNATFLSFFVRNITAIKAEKTSMAIIF
jgi:hypothetical protein